MKWVSQSIDNYGHKCTKKQSSVGDMKIGPHIHYHKISVRKKKEAQNMGFGFVVTIHWLKYYPGTRNLDINSAGY